ncbi:MAG TPA: hypothetical protein VIT18_04860 [Terrimicrobiaceae bacterium]
MIKTLDTKVADILANPSGSKAFIIADAKDADMAFGVAAPGPRRSPKANEYETDWKTLAEFRTDIRDVIQQGIVDIMLLSASNVEVLAMEERLFENSTVTPAARANDTSDIWAVRGGKYPRQASRSFRTATLDHIMYGHLDPKPGEKIIGADLGLYSITFTNDLDAEHYALREFHEFRLEAERKGFRYFLEVFNPNVEPGIAETDIPAFVNDHVIRSLAGVTKRGRPLFLKIAYNGPKALAELVSYDSQLIVGILGGSAGTTYDAFKLIADAQKYGARVALFGRKINLSEDPLTFIEMLRHIVDHEITPEDAVKAYHSAVQKLGLRPFRELPDDMQLTGTMMRYR